jgi:hypothetical protein
MARKEHLMSPNTRSKVLARLNGFKPKGLDSFMDTAEKLADGMMPLNVRRETFIESRTVEDFINHLAGFIRYLTSDLERKT